MYWIIFASRQKRFKGQAMANLIRVAILALVCVPAFASISSRRATITGGGPQGKCTIEVSVDETADVEVFGDNGVLRTLSGQPAFWKRFVCNAPLPQFPYDFRFVGVDGRGQVHLIRDPRDNRGKAVVRIVDRKGGREGYTFDLIWRAALNPSLPPGRGGMGIGPTERAQQTCQAMVADQISAMGFRGVTFQNTAPDNRPGRGGDRVKGTATARRGPEAAWFSFTCSSDFQTGRTYSADVQRR
jgi:hypothetical protein